MVEFRHNEASFPLSSFPVLFYGVMSYLDSYDLQLAR